MAEHALSTSITVRLIGITCYKCGVAFGMSEPVYDRRRRDHEDFWCPAGHAQHFIGKSDLEREKEEKERVVREAEFLKRRLAAEVGTNRALRGTITKKNKKLERVKAGVCPCCNRTFQNLQRHMNTKHKDAHL